MRFYDLPQGVAGERTAAFALLATRSISLEGVAPRSNDTARRAASVETGQLASIAKPPIQG
jgi:hypothetical protein